jgi:Nitroreductase family
MGAMPVHAQARASPEPRTAEEIIQYVVADAVWAPSVHNTQPWLFGAEGQEISLRADPDRSLRVADRDGRELLISCGTALFNVRLALRSLGYVPTTRVLPDPADPMLVARVSWQQRAAASQYERRLASRIRQRRTHRGGFDPAPLPPNLLAALRDGAWRDGAMLRVVADDGRRAVLAAAVEEAERALRLDAAHMRELASWVSPPGSTRRDGVPPSCYPARAERTDPHFPGRDFAHGHGWGLPPLSSARAHRAAGVAGLLTTADDRPVDWVNAGQALQRVLLTAAAHGVAAALHSQPLELGWLRESIRTRLSDHAYPQMVLRFGTVIQVAASVRRAPAEVLIQG